MGKSKCTITLSDDQRSFLEGLIHRGKPSASTIRHAYIQLHADKPDPEVAEVVWCHPQSMFNVRKAFVTQELDAALHRKLRNEPPIPRKLDGAGEAGLIQIACSKPPEGRSRWKLQLLADRLVELEIVDTISIKTVERTLKNALQPHTKKQWVIPPAENGNYVAAMEDVLEVYQRPYDLATRSSAWTNSQSSCMPRCGNRCRHNPAVRNGRTMSARETGSPAGLCPLNRWDSGAG